MARKTKDLEKETNLIEKKLKEDSKNTQALVISSRSQKATKNKKTSKKSNETSKIKGSSVKVKKKSATKKITKSMASQNLNTLSESGNYFKRKIKCTSNLSKIRYKSSKKVQKNKFKTEYYDLPFSYNKTVVKILAQTPTTLFVYWELSEKDADDFRKKYGDNFFDITKPILVLYNDTKNYVYEIEINDFANSWYINVNDSKCEYHVELGRKPISTSHNSNNNFSNNTNANSNENSVYIPYYVYITSSNEMILPNDKILFNPETNSKIAFRNIKTGVIKERNIGEFKFITNYGIFTIQELYKYLYPNENFEYEEFLRNPSSGLRSSMSSR